MSTQLSQAERKVLIVGILALIVAMVTYGYLTSTGTFSNDVWNLSGGIVGFLIAALILNKVYGQPNEGISPELKAFFKSVEGYWWTIGGDPDSIGFASLTPSGVGQTLSLKGRSFGMDGSVVAHWDSVASCVYLEKKKLYYFWEGRWTGKGESPNEGFGEIVFYNTENQANSGLSIYFDRNLGNVESTIKKECDYHRCTDKEARDFEGGDKIKIAALVKDKLMDNKNPPGPR